MNDISTLFPNNDNNELTRNFRNRYNIYNFARHFIPHDVRANTNDMLERLSQQNPGGLVELHIENSSEGVYNKIKTIIENRGQGNIGILLSYIADVDKYSEALDNKNIEQVCVVGTEIPQPIALVVLSERGKNKTKEDLIFSLEETLEVVNPKLEKHEKIHNIIIVKEEWTIENNLLTPTMKIKRNDIEKIYRINYEKWYDSSKKIVFPSK